MKVIFIINELEVCVAGNVKDKITGKVQKENNKKVQKKIVDNYKKEKKMTKRKKIPYIQ